MSSGISIVPPGFEITAHPIFLRYKPVCERNDRLSDISSSFPSSSFQNYQLSTRLTSPIESYNDHLPFCGICLQTSVDPITLGSCSHSFCFECVMTWFAAKPTCPICNTTVEYIIKSCEISHRHPSGLKVLKLMSPKHSQYHSRASSQSLDAWKTSLKKALAKHKSILSVDNIDARSYLEQPCSEIRTGDRNGKKRKCEPLIDARNNGTVEAS